MKQIFVFLFMGLAVEISAQTASVPDSFALKGIDSLVAAINGPGHRVERDSIFRDVPEAHMSSRTWLTAVSDGNNLLKYVNQVRMETEAAGRPDTTFGENIFYYWNGALIKVEEWLARGGKRQDFQWYFRAGNLLHGTMAGDKAASRARQLLQMAEGFQTAFKSGKR